MSPYRPIQLEAAPYKLSAGVETKVHGLALPPPKLQQCENAYIDESGSIQRRFGRNVLENLTTLETPIVDPFVALGKHQERLLGFTKDKLYDYGEPDGRWADRGRCVSWVQEMRPVESVTTNWSSPRLKDMAIIGPYRCFVYDYYDNASTGTVAFTLVDEKGTRYAANQILGKWSSIYLEGAPKVVAFNQAFYIVYHDNRVGANALQCFRIDMRYPSTIAASLVAAPTNLANDLATNGALDMDVHPTYGPQVTYVTTAANQVKMAFINNAGTLTFPNLVPIAGSAFAMAVAPPANGNFIAFGYRNNAAVNNIFVQIWTFNGAAWAVVSVSPALDNALTLQLGPMALWWDSATVLRVFYGDLGPTYPCVRQALYTTGGAVTMRVQKLPRACLAAKPFREVETGTLYMPVILEQYAPIGVDLKVTTPELFIMTFDGKLTGAMSPGIAAMDFALFNIGLGPHTLCRVVRGELGENDYHFLTDQFSRLVSTGFAVGSGSLTVMAEAIIRAHPDPETHCMVENNECTYICGGMLQQYDGVGVTEVNFRQPLNSLRATVVGFAGSGAMLSGQYSYQFIPEWINAQGVREQGTNLGTVLVTLAGGMNCARITLDGMPFTLKQKAYGRPNMVIAVYRSLVGTVFKATHYRTGQIENDPTLDRLPMFTDNNPDSYTKVQETCYLDSGVVDNVPPGAGGHIITAGNGRVFVAGYPDDPNLIFYSKQRGKDEGLAFNEALTIYAPKAIGKIMALGVLNESLVILGEHGIARTNGDGLNNTGTSGGFLDPVGVQSDAGSLGMRSTVVTPGGVLFESRKGKMLLSPSFQVQYIGSPLEKLPPPTGPCTGAVIIPQLQQSRHSYADVTHVYDYFHGQWYVFTHGSDGPTTVWGELHTAISSGVVFDDQDAFDDAGTSYHVTLELAWFHSDALFADLMVRKIALTGYGLETAFLYVTIANNQLGWHQDILRTLPTGPIQLSWRLERRVLSQILITIRDAWFDAGLPVTIPGKGWRLNELTFEIGKRTPMLGRGAE